MVDSYTNTLDYSSPLTFHSHIILTQYVVKLERLTHTELYALLQLYLSLVRPHLEYAGVRFGIHIFKTT